MEKERVKNTATAEQICGILKGSVDGLQDDNFKQLDLDKLSVSYEKYLARLFHITQRPILSVLKQGCKLAFRDTATEADCLYFASRVHDCVQYVHAKSKSMTSGTKTGSSSVSPVQSLLDDLETSKQPRETTVRVLRD